MLAGRTLKALRNARSLTGRQVEEASRRIAAVKGDKRFSISNGWLTQLEKGVSEPGICKIFSLSAIYKVKFFDLIRLFDVNIDDVEKYEPVAYPNLTQLMTAKLHNDDDLHPVPETLRSMLHQSPTHLLPGTIGSRSGPLLNQLQDPGRAPISYGYIGLKDFTMYPMIRPGSIVRIDTSQIRLQSVSRHNEYERPIYFVELRNGYACSWCELQDKELLIIPHHSSPHRIRRFKYMKEAEIVGRVIGFDTRCVDEDPGASDIRVKPKRVSARNIG